MKNYLNYLWISNPSHYWPPNFRSGSPIPAEYVNNAFEVASKNPDVTAYVWCDFSLMEEGSKEFLDRLAAKPANLEFRDLNDIPSYSDDGFFHKTSVDLATKELCWKEGQTIWRRVDLARLLVLQHTLRLPDADAAFYSDLDVLDPPVCGEEAEKMFEQHGCILGHFYYIPKHKQGVYFENGFMGFKKKHFLNITTRFIPEAKKSIFKNNDPNCWVAFRECAGDICGCGNGDGLDIKKISGFSIEINTIWGAGTYMGKVLFDENCLIIGQENGPIERPMRPVYGKQSGARCVAASNEGIGRGAFPYPLFGG